MRRIRSPRSSGSETRNLSSCDASLSSGSSGFSTGSGSSSSSSSGSRRNPISAAVWVIGFVSCFGSPDSNKYSGEDYSETPKTPQRSLLTNSHETERRKSGKGLYTSKKNSSERESGVRRFTMTGIQKATKNFSPTLKIGQGGFGTVYKGKLDDGMVVAIKRAKKNADDNRLGAEFQNEIQTMASIEHLNLVRFFGYLEYEDERILVIEYVPNGTLREHLDCLRGNPLDLAARLDIAIDIAHAVTYLHMYTDRAIIHRDIKSSNILLTENLRAKVADFGFARLGSMDADVTHVSTQVKGTAGYLDPEYLQTYQLTVKSDVYSFGVLLVEMISGRRPIEQREMKERITVRWLKPNYEVQVSAAHLSWPINRPKSEAPTCSVHIPSWHRHTHVRQEYRKGKLPLCQCSDITINNAHPKSQEPNLRCRCPCFAGCRYRGRGCARERLREERLPPTEDSVSPETRRVFSDLPGLFQDTQSILGLTGNYRQQLAPSVGKSDTHGVHTQPRSLPTTGKSTRWAEPLALLRRLARPLRATKRPVPQPTSSMSFLLRR